MNPVQTSILSLLRPSRKRVVGRAHYRAARSDADTPGFAFAVATFFGRAAALRSNRPDAADRVPNGLLRRRESVSSRPHQRRAPLTPPRTHDGVEAERRFQALPLFFDDLPAQQRLGRHLPIRPIPPPVPN